MVKKLAKSCLFRESTKLQPETLKQPVESNMISSHEKQFDIQIYKCLFAYSGTLHCDFIDMTSG